MAQCYATTKIASALEAQCCMAACQSQEKLRTWAGPIQCQCLIMHILCSSLDMQNNQTM